VTGADLGRKPWGAGWEVQRVRGGSGKDFSNSCWEGLKFAGAGRERTKIFNPRRTLVSAIPVAYLTSLLDCYSTRHSRSPMFCSCELRCRSVECVLLHCFDEQPYIFAVVKCAGVALSVLCSPVLTRCRMFL